MKLLFFLAGLVLLSGCTTTLTNAERAQMQRIGVVSLFGDRVTANYVSLTAFTHQHYEERAAGLGIDEIVEEEAARWLGPSGVPLPAERGVGRSTRFLGIRDVSIDSANIVAAVQRQELDGLVVVYPLLYHGSPANLEGVTLMGHHSYRDEVRPVLLGGVNYYDGRTGRSRGFAALHTHHDSDPARLPDGTSVLWRKSYSAYSPEDRAAIAGAIRKQFRESLRDALGRMGLLGR